MYSPDTVTTFCAYKFAGRGRIRIRTNNFLTDIVFRPLRNCFLLSCNLTLIQFKQRIQPFVQLLTLLLKFLFNHAFGIFHRHLGIIGNLNADLLIFIR